MTAQAPPHHQSGTGAPPRAKAQDARLPRVLITGASSPIGARVTARLHGQPGLRVVAVDWAPGPNGTPDPSCAKEPPPSTRFLDLLTGEVERACVQDNVRTIVHLQWLPARRSNREAARSVNVEGTRRLAQIAASLAEPPHLIFVSSNTVFAPSADQPCFIPSLQSRRGRPPTPDARHRADAEALLQEISDRTRLPLTILRMPPIAFTSPLDPLVRHLTQRRVLLPLGFDPRLQLIALDDAVEMVARAALARPGGALHAAGPGVLPMRRAIRLLGGHAISLPGRALDLALGKVGSVTLRGEGELAPNTLRFPSVLDPASAELRLGVRARQDLAGILARLAEHLPQDEDPAEQAEARRLAQLEARAGSAGGRRGA
ncbi:MAG: NAD-dependent epimerase/dehydratase family protein [Planctomycetota bacterium]|jgi:nucleoside-diphosphate-sugar epimerase